MKPIQPGDRVRFHLDAKLGLREGWFTGTVFRIDPYSEHRCFYWIKLDPDARALLGITEISVFNPRNIELLPESS